jgi:hypothetical protein
MTSPPDPLSSRRGGIIFPYTPTPKGSNMNNPGF